MVMVANSEKHILYPVQTRLNITPKLHFWIGVIHHVYKKIFTTEKTSVKFFSSVSHNHRELY